MNGTVEQLSNKLCINKPQFSEWKNAVLSNINFQINKYNNNFQHQKCKPILNNTSVKESFGKLQHDFVVATVDKAANNEHSLVLWYQQNITVHPVSKCMGYHKATVMNKINRLTKK